MSSTTVSLSDASELQLTREVDTGWGTFWIILCSVCYLLYSMVPNLVILPSAVGEFGDASNISNASESLSWVWTSLAFSGEGIYQNFGFFLSAGFAFIFLLAVKILRDKATLSVVLVFIILQLVLFILIVLPQLPELKSLVRQLGILGLVVSASFILVGSHLQKNLTEKLYPEVLLALGGLILLVILLLPIDWPVGTSSLLKLMNASAWSVSQLPLSICLTLSFVLAMVALLGLFVSTRNVMSTLTRSVLISLPVVLYFYYSDVRQLSILHSLLETLRYTLLLIASLILPVSLAALLEKNTDLHVGE